MGEFARILFFVAHYTQPFLCIAVVFFSFFALFNKKNNFLTFLLLEDSSKVQLNLRETLIGSSGDCDIKLSGCLKEHFVITQKNNSVLIRPLKGKPILVNGKEIKGEVSLNPYDVVTAGKREFSVRRKRIVNKKQKTGTFTALSVLSLLLFELFILLQFAFLSNFKVVLYFLIYVLFQVIYLAVVKPFNANIELVVFMLVTIGLTVTAGMGSVVLLKQLICLFAGFGVAVLIYYSFVSPKLANALKIPAVILGLALFAANIVIGAVYNGSQNWIEIGNVSFQPSEFIKVILVYLSAATADKIEKRHNTTGLTIFVGICVAVLAYLRDFGTAAVYLALYLAVVMLRKCDWRYFLTVIGGGVAVVGIATFAFPYVAKRIFSFGHAWENAFSTGFQQTRTMIAAASGGLLGVGTSNGYLRNVTAFDTDIVFGVICEELGIITGVCVVVSFVLMAFYAIKLFNSSTPFCAITACAAVMVFMAQASLNVFGSLDMLPFTGVTLPFISNGGSSAICCVALIAFFKAAEREAKTLNEK